jgi:hypothetical protein
MDTDSWLVSFLTTQSDNKHRFDTIQKTRREDTSNASRMEWCSAQQDLWISCTHLWNHQSDRSLSILVFILLRIHSLGPSSPLCGAYISCNHEIMLQSEVLCRQIWVQHLHRHGRVWDQLVRPTMPGLGEVLMVQRCNPQGCRVVQSVITSPAPEKKCFASSPVYIYVY